MEKNEIKTLDTKQVNGYKWFKKLIRCVQRNASALTFLTASVVAVGSVVIRCIMYLFEYGKTVYYNISSSLIDVSGENILYDFFVKGLFVLIFILLNFIPYLIWKSKLKTGVKVVYSFLIVLFPAIIYFLIDVIRGVNFSIGDICILFLCGLLLGVALFSLGMYYGISEYCSKQRQEKKCGNKQKNKDENEPQKEENKLSRSKIITKIIMFIVIFFTIESILFIFVGVTKSASQNHFKIINNDDNTYYAVIYENPSKYVITECEIEGNYISFSHRDTHQEIDRDGVKYQWQTLTQRR